MYQKVHLNLISFLSQIMTDMQRPSRQLRIFRGIKSIYSRSFGVSGQLSLIKRLEFTSLRGTMAEALPAEDNETLKRAFALSSASMAMASGMESSAQMSTARKSSKRQHHCTCHPLMCLVEQGELYRDGDRSEKWIPST